MGLKRTASILVGGVALAAWLSAAIAPGRPAATRPSTAAPAIDASGAALAHDIARLRERLRPSTLPEAPARNPFTFERSARRQSPDPGVRVTAPPAPADQRDSRDRADRPRLSLAGIAEDAGPVRTAIIAGGGQVWLVRLGDPVTDRGITYTVAEISADSVDLIDARDGATWRLTFK